MATAASGRTSCRPTRPTTSRAVAARSYRHIRVRIARKGIDSSEKLGRHRWVVERTLAWLGQYRRLTIRYEQRADIHDAFLTLACALICFKALP
jgi:transposase